MRYNKRTITLRHKKKVSRHTRVAASDALKEQVTHFTEYHSPSRLSKNLRTMLIEFLMYDGATEASYLQDLLFDMQGTFDLLDALELEKQANFS